MLAKRNNVIFPSLINEFLGPDWFGGMENLNTIPAVNIREIENEFSLELAIPGFTKDDFNIEVDNDILTISAEVKKDNEIEREQYTRREFTINSFKRAFTLPETVNEDEIKASYDGGILKVSLPKKDEALPKPKRLIEIG